jgi:hypothetical protein
MGWAELVGALLDNMHESRRRSFASWLRLTRIELWRRAHAEVQLALAHSAKARQINFNWRQFQ